MRRRHAPTRTSRPSSRRSPGPGLAGTSASPTQPAPCYKPLGCLAAALHHNPRQHACRPAPHPSPRPSPQVGQRDNPNYRFLNLFGAVLDHKLVAENYLRASGLGWAVVRPGGLSNEPPEKVGGGGWGWGGPGTLRAAALPEPCAPQPHTPSPAPSIQTPSPCRWATWSCPRRTPCLARLPGPPPPSPPQPHIRLALPPHPQVGNLVVSREDSLFALESDPGRAISRDLVRRPRLLPGPGPRGGAGCGLAERPRPRPVKRARRARSGGRPRARGQPACARACMARVPSCRIAGQLPPWSPCVTLCHSLSPTGCRGASGCAARPSSHQQGH